MKTYPLAHQNQQHQLEQPQPQITYKQGLQKQQQQQEQQYQPKYKVCKKETDVALVIGRAAWWIPVLATNNNMRNSTFAEALRDFLRHVSFHCYGKLVETGRRYQERLFWLVFHVAALSLLIIFLLDEQLLTTSIYDNLYPIHKVSFPAISVCSINRISNASVARYAEELNNKDPKKRGVNFFYEKIRMLQYNYYNNDELRDYEKALRFQRFLDIFDREDGEMFHNTRRRMAELTPNCTDILVKCRLGGKDIDCAKEFVEKFTDRGLCCTFNNNGKYSVERNFQNRFVGPEMGLVVLLNAPKQDTFYKTFTLDGFTINVHSPYIYPDQHSGGSEERLALTGITTLLSLTPSLYRTANEARFLKPKVRNCLFWDEMPAMLENNYSFSNCITYCRIYSILVLCECLLFMSPYVIKSNDTVFCSLQHKECLMRYNFKWFNVITQRQDIPGLEREMEDALYCPQCLPTCSETRYNVQVMGLPLNEYDMKAFPAHQHNYSDLAMVRVYFGVTHALYYKRFRKDSWFEVLSNVGNICGVIAGFSLIGVCEVIFFCLLQLYKAYKNEVLSDSNGILRNQKTEKSLIILP